MPELPSDGKTLVNEKIAELSVRGAIDTGKIGKSKSSKKKLSAKQKRRSEAARERGEKFMEVLHVKKTKAKEKYKKVTTFRKADE